MMGIIIGTTALVVLVGVISLGLAAGKEMPEPDITEVRDGDKVVVDAEHDGFVHECCQCGLRHLVRVEVVLPAGYQDPDDYRTEIAFVRLPDGNLRGFDFSKGQCVRLDEVARDD